MDELERLFKHVVDILAEGGEDRLRQPLQVSELYQDIVPYRRYRSVLRFDTNQDYEMALLRLLSGERGWVTLDPPEVQEALRREVSEVNPNPAAFREFAAATLTFDRAAVRRALDRRDRYAPPEPPSANDIPETGEPLSDPADFAVEANENPAPDAAPPPKSLVFEPVAQPQTCRACRKELPSGRTVVFCPFCGADQRIAVCHQCGTELELDWEFCIACGARSQGN